MMLDLSPEERSVAWRRLFALEWPWCGCWVWEGCTNHVGYGVISFRGKRWYTHRLAFALTHGGIPDGLVLDHLCRNTLCFRPSHLEAVTTRVNILRGMTAQKTHCNQGHEFTPDNTLRTATGHRRCRECRNACERRRRRRHRLLTIGA